MSKDLCVHVHACTLLKNLSLTRVDVFVVVLLRDESVAWFDCFSQSSLSPLLTTFVTWLDFKKPYQVRSLSSNLMPIAKQTMNDSRNVLEGQKWSKRSFLKLAQTTN